MATTGYNGRDMTITWDSSVLTGVRMRGVTINNEPVDITTDDDSGFGPCLLILERALSISTLRALPQTKF